MTAAVWGEEAAGATNPRATGGRGVASSTSGPSQSLPDLDTIDTTDLGSVCDCDVDALVAWQLQRALQSDALARAAAAAALQCLRAVGILPALDVQAQLRELTAAGAARSALRGDVPSRDLVLPFSLYSR